MLRISQLFLFMCIVFSLQAQDATFSGKVFLQGAYDPNTFLMRTLLVQHGDFPTQQPYDREPWQYPGTETLLTVPDSLVDWILIELRSGEDFSYQEYQKAVLLKKDGTILDTNMSPLISFPGIKPGSYYLILRHRNHMPVMTAQPVNLPNQAPIDFTDTTQTPVFGGNTIGMIELTAGLFGMIAGDINEDQVLKFSGSGNDRSKVITTLVAKTGSQAITSTITGYHDEDINLDTIVKYSGANNDPSRIIQNINQLTGSTSINTVHRTHVPGEFKCGDDLVDLRDGKTYPTVKIGRQCWMAKNLDHGQWIVDTLGQADNQLVEKFCYDNNLQNCQLYGGLYQWDEMMAYQLDQYDQGICPVGWHLPTDQEWYELEKYLDSTIVDPNAIGWRGMLAGNALKQGGTSGFNSMLGGYYNDSVGFTSTSTEMRFWTSTAISSKSPYFRGLNEANSGVFRDEADTNDAYAVRCIKGIPIKANPKLIIIDTNVTKLISDSLQLSQGIYVYLHSGKSPIIVDTSYIIMDTVIQNGYLRYVTDTISTSPFLALQTRQGTFEDLFVSGSYSAETKWQLTPDTSKNSTTGWKEIEYLAEGVSITNSKGGLLFDFTPGFKPLLEYKRPDGLCSITLSITEGHVLFDPNWSFEFEHQDHMIKKLAVYMNQAILEDEVEISLNAECTHHFTEKSIELARYKHTFKFIAGGVPVWVVFKVQLMAYSEANIEGAIDLTAGYTNTRTLDLGLRYEYPHWQKIFKYGQNREIRAPIPTASIGLNQKLSIVPKIEVRLYGIAGPYLEAEVFEEFDANVEFTTGDWDAKLNLGIGADLKADITIFGKTLAECKLPILDEEWTLWNTPDSVIKISGDNQTANAGQQLALPIKVKVVDNLKNGSRNSTVHFDVQPGGGSVSKLADTTDSDGYADVLWTLGPNPGEQTLNVSVRSSDGDDVKGSPVVFTAYSTGSSTFTCGATLTDTRDGQQYPTVQIGTQCWMAKNLNIGTMVSGSSNQTNNSTIEKYCYSNDANNCAIYGGLYQWNEMMNYTTTPGTQGICPTGWHIPTDAEWCTLTTYLDPTVNCNTWGWSGTNAGGKLKESGFSFWSSPNSGATNSSGFGARGGGVRYASGQFATLNEFANIWSSTEYTSSTVWDITLVFNQAGVAFFEEPKAESHSVRCIKDINPLPLPFSCGDDLHDIRDNQLYPTVQIGTQCWMAKNLNIGTMVSGSSNQTNNSTIEKYCYSNDANNCAIYGGLYQWNEMMNYTTTPGTQGICPTGWHIPTDAEWCTLSTHLDATVNCNINGGSGTNAGGKMKATGTTHWYLPNTGATNSSGFTALGAGNRIDNGGFNNLKYDATFWSSSASSSTYAKHLYLTYDYARVHWYSHTKTRGFSVRCLRNN